MRIATARSAAQAVSYTTGVPAFIGAALMLHGTWSGAGVFNTEQLDPDPFMEMLNASTACRGPSPSCRPRSSF